MNSYRSSVGTPDVFHLQNKGNVTIYFKSLSTKVALGYLVSLMKLMNVSILNS